MADGPLARLNYAAPRRPELGGRVAMAAAVVAIVAVLASGSVAWTLLLMRR